MITGIKPRTEKARYKTDIDCRRKADRCPLKDGVKYKKYRSVFSCWGCRFAFWIDSGEPYGPRDFQRTKFVIK